MVHCRDQPGSIRVIQACCTSREGAGIGVHTPFKQPADGARLDVDTRTYNALLRSLRCLGERGFALLVGRWRVLHHVTACPQRIGDVTKAALVLTHIEHGYQSC